MSSALWTAVKLRYDTQTLKQLTNVNTPGGTSINDTIGVQVATDARMWFSRKTQMTFDSTDDEHVAVAVRATYCLLREYSGKYSEVVRSEKEAVEDAMNDLRIQGPAARIQPVTDSTLEPSGQEDSTDPTRPTFDPERFDRLMPDPPPAP